MWSDAVYWFLLDFRLLVVDMDYILAPPGVTNINYTTLGICQNNKHTHLLIHLSVKLFVNFYRINDTDYLNTV